MTQAAIPWLIGASIGLQAYQGKRQHDVLRKQEDQAKQARIKAEQTEKAKAALRIQGIQEQATAPELQSPDAETGGIPMTIKERLTIKDTGVTT